MVITPWAVFVQVFASVPVTVYVVFEPGAAVMHEPCCPELHVYVVAFEAQIVPVTPGQTAVLVDAIGGNWLTVTTAVDVAVSPTLSLAVMV